MKLSEPHKDELDDLPSIDTLSLGNEGLEELINDMPNDSAESLKAVKKGVLATPSKPVNPPEPSKKLSLSNLMKKSKVKNSKMKKSKVKKSNPWSKKPKDNNPTDFLDDLPDKPKASPDKLKWLLYGLIGLLILAIGAFVFSNIFGADADEKPTVKPKVATQNEMPLETEEPKPNPTINEVDSSTTSTNPKPLEPAIEGIDNLPDPAEILSAELPQTEVMAKEEIDRLLDESERLEEQGKLIAEQVAVMDELSSKKEEQIALLEQQISVLETQKNAE